MIQLLLTWLILDGNIISLKVALQSPSRLISSLKKFLKLAEIFSRKMLMEADETKCMVNSIMLCERFAIVSNFQKFQLIELIPDWILIRISWVVCWRVYRWNITNFKHFVGKCVFITFSEG